jgi:dihydroorotate dehydrogenase electron transfer subunit
MLRLLGTSDPLLARPFALYDTIDNEDIDIVYLVVGKMTGLLPALRPGDRLELVGPLGNGFVESTRSMLTAHNVRHLGLVAGGIGQTPFLALIRDLLGKHGYAGESPIPRVERISLYYGVRSADLAACVEDFRNAGATVHLASDDGSLGFKGYVTQLLANAEDVPQMLIGCGPEPMLHSLADLAKQRGIACQVSLETPMACGVGICFSCVAKVQTPQGEDYRRVCVEGPVFDAAKLVW